MLNLLVTGAAGLIGGEVSARLAAAGHGVHALIHRNPEVRGNDGQTVALAGVHGGDITLPSCGLDPDVLGSIDVVIHAAASLRFDLTDAEYAAVNVEGTARALELAATLGAAFLYVSTAYVCGLKNGPVAEAPVHDDADFANGYEASKAAAEALVRASGLRHAIARPSIVLGAAASGRIRQFDTIYQAFKLFAEGRIRHLPASAGATLDFVAIDHVAAGIAALAERMGAADGGIFHLVSDGALPVADFCAGIGEWPQFAAPEPVDPAAFDPAALPPLERRLYARVAAVYASYFQRSPVFDDTRLRALTGLAAPVADADYSGGRSRSASRKGFCAAPRWRRRGSHPHPSAASRLPSLSRWERDCISLSHREREGARSAQPSGKGEGDCFKPLPHIRIVLRHPLARPDRPQYAHLEVDPVGLPRSPRRDAAVRGVDEAKHQPDPSDPRHPDAQIRLLHHLIAWREAADRQKIDLAEVHRMVAEQQPHAPQEQMRAAQQRRVPGLGPVVRAGQPAGALVRLPADQAG